MLSLHLKVRPFNQRELDAKSSLIVSMTGPTTILLPPPTLAQISSTTSKSPPAPDPKTFTFDYSFWSHDGFEEDPHNGKLHPIPGTSNGYIDQQHVYETLGRTVMENAWQGYNTTLLAYGQTGSGKSYSMFGYGPNKGIVPIFCEDLFKTIEEKMTSDANLELNVFFSMLEIYQDKVRDLLTLTTPTTLKRNL